MLRYVLAASVCFSFTMDAEARGGRGGGKSSSWSRSSGSSWSAPSRRPYTPRSSGRSSSPYGFGSWSGDPQPTDDEVPIEPIETSIEDEDFPLGSPSPERGQVPDYVAPGADALTPSVEGDMVESSPSALVTVELVGRARTPDDVGHCVSQRSLVCIWDGENVDAWPVAVDERGIRSWTGAPIAFFTEDRHRPSLDEIRAAVGYRPVSMLEVPAEPKPK
jgi:hypothetical protein